MALHVDGGRRGAVQRRGKQGSRQEKGDLFAISENFKDLNVNQR